MIDIHKLNSDPLIARYNTIGIPENIQRTISLHEHMIDGVQQYGWAIHSKTNGNFKGIIGVKHSAPRYNSAEVFYSICSKSWNKGYATESLKMVIDYLFNNKKLHRIDAGCAVNNTGSIKVLEKCNFQKEGRKRKVLPLTDGWSDNFQFAILSEDYFDQ